MKVLVIGNLGYIGSVTGKYLNNNGFSVCGLDAGYYAKCLLDSNHQDIPTTAKDIRDIQKEDLQGFDAIVNLAALSNDPIGELDSSLTFEINRDAAIKSAELAKQAGVKRYIFVSSQSIYGISTSLRELEEDDPKSPQTAYAQSKWEAEQKISSISSLDFVTTVLRPSTVFGWSPRLRSDIVFNNLLLSGLINGKIEVHSDGSPWRPIVHVNDLAEAIRLCIGADPRKVSGQAFNIGKLGGNYKVSEIASAANKCLGNLEVVYNTEDIKDSRTYKVSFRKAAEVLGFSAQRDLVESGQEMLEKFRNLDLDLQYLSGRLTNRLAQVSYLINNGSIDGNLRFR